MKTTLKHLLIIIFIYSSSVSAGVEFNAKELKRAIKDRNWNAVEQLLSTENGLASKDNNGATALHIAVMHQAPLEILRMMVKHGYDANQPDLRGETPLHYAIRMKGVEGAKHLLQAGADLNHKNQRYILHDIAYSSEYNSVLKYLVSRGADVNAVRDSNGSLLYTALRGENYEIVDFLIEKDVNPNAIANFHPGTALEFAKVYGRTDIEEKLVKHGAIDTDEFYDYHNRYFDAVKAGDLGEIKRVLSDGWHVDNVLKSALAAQRHSLDNDKTALVVASEFNRLNVIKYLVRLGATLDGSSGLHALHAAIENDNAKTIRYLIDEIGIEELQDKDLLATAATNGRLLAVKELIDLGFDVEGNKRWPLDLALSKEHMDVATELLENGASLYLEKDELRRRSVDRLLSGLFRKRRFGMVLSLQGFGYAPTGREYTDSYSREMSADAQARRAVVLGDMARLEQLVAKGHRFSLKKLTNVLRWAIVDKARIDLVRFVEANSESSLNITPLMIAVVDKNYKLMKELIKQENVDEVDFWKRSALHYALINEDSTAIKLLLTRPQSYDPCKLEGKSLDRLSVIHFDQLFSEFLDSDFSDLQKFCLFSNDRALKVAIHRGNTNVVRKMLSGLPEMHKNTATKLLRGMSFAVEKNDLEMVKIFLNAGINPLLGGLHSPLSLAMHRNREAIIDLILDKILESPDSSDIKCSSSDLI